MDKKPVKTRATDSNPGRYGLDAGAAFRIRFRKPDELQDYLENAEEEELIFSAIPFSGEPETFRYNSRERAIVRTEDGALFDSVADFICYAFQCDSEGYPRTEYVDVVFG